ncbi:MAG: glucoamylase family protein [Propionibacteriaceae bacterium]|nr:glucoamylase family protein [Propionibacteriaceae bacterium]
MTYKLSRRGLLGATAGVGVITAISTLPAGADPEPGTSPTHDKQLYAWASDTWASMTAMTDEKSGLVADNIDGDLLKRSGYTSPTNIGGYLWCCIVARDLGIISGGECSTRISKTLATLARIEKHEPSGMFYNWYDEATGAVLYTWPEDGNVVYPFVSSVDMGWLGAALHVVAEADPANSIAASKLFEAMRWDMFYDKKFGPKGEDGPTGGIYGGFWTAKPGQEADLLPSAIGEGEDVWYTKNHYDTTISEARMVTYLGIIRGQLPDKVYFSTFRTFPPPYDWQEMTPVGEEVTYLGVPVYQGAYTYRGFQVVPGWGGSMFEELMPDLFVPEATWAPNSWGRNHPLHVRAQREHGLDDAKYGYWGFSPCSDPAGGYREYGVDALGMNPEGYFSDQEKTNYVSTKPPTTYGDGVVTPHAAFLAMMYEPENARENLAKLQKDFKSYGTGGFYDAVAVKSGKVAKRHLSLDQSMCLGALGNVMLSGRLHKYFATPAVERALRPLLAMEEFNVEPTAVPSPEPTKPTPTPSTKPTSPTPKPSTKPSPTPSATVPRPTQPTNKPGLPGTGV